MRRLLELVYLVTVMGISMALIGDIEKDAKGQAQEPPEYCEAESFTADCADDEVILIKYARYGRMRAGRCVVRNYGYLGCAADVLPHLDWKCSGKQSCEVRIPDQALDAVNPCPADLKTYLEAEYECIEVVNPPCQACELSNQSAVISTPSGHLASTVVTSNGCGTGLCPWVIQEAEGRRINLTLFDFSVPGGTNPGAGHHCDRLALIQEADGSHGNHRVEVCSGLGRETHVYTSQTSMLEVIVDPSFMADGVTEQRRFIIKYEGFGCSDLAPPKDAWVKREGDTLIVGCTGADSTYHLACENNRWTGTIGSCPQTASTQELTDTMPLPHHPMGIMVAIAIGIALIIGSLVLTLGLIYVRRRGLTRASEVNTSPTHYPSPDPRLVFMSKMANPCSPQCQKDCYQAILAKHRPNDYEYAMEMRPLPEAPDQTYSTSPYGCGTGYARQGPGYARQGPAGVHCNPAFQRVLPPCDFIYHHSADGAVSQPKCCSRHYFELDPDHIEIMSISAEPTVPLTTRKPKSNFRVTTEERQNKANKGKEFTRQRSYNGPPLSNIGALASATGRDTPTQELLAVDHSSKFSWP